MPGEDAMDLLGGAQAAVSTGQTAGADAAEITPEQRDVTGLEVIDAAALVFDAPPEPPGDAGPIARLESSDQIETVRLADPPVGVDELLVGRACDKDGSSAEPVARSPGTTVAPSSSPDDSGVFRLDPPLDAGGPLDDADAGDGPTTPDADTGAVVALAETGGPVESGSPPAAAPAASAGAPAASAEPLAPVQILESVLFAAHEPLAAARLGSIVGDLDARTVRRMIDELNGEYARAGRAFSIQEVAGGWQVFTRAEFNPWLKKLYKARAEGKLSQTSLLTLAIVAYKQPIKRVDIEAIRGAACGEVLRALMDKGLVKIVGREESLGRPLLYGTTRKFLQVFGLGSLKDLPKTEELGKP
jgi:segregation and condensation protein B